MEAIINFTYRPKIKNQGLLHPYLDIKLKIIENVILYDEVIKKIKKFEGKFNKLFFKFQTESYDLTSNSI